MALRASLAAGLGLSLAAALAAADFYVSPTASGSGNGSLNNPWQLQTALNQPSSVHPGDTVWLRGGTYQGEFTSNLDGSSGNPITVRQYPGERATLDGNGSSSSPLTVAGSYTTFWGFEVTNSDTNRPHVDFSRPAGITINQDVSHPGMQFVNLIVHDTGSAFGFWTQASNSEINGCVIYYNGNTQLDHGIYAQNQTGFKKITDNVLFNNYGHGIHVYGSDSAYLNGFDVEGNTTFNNGLLSTGSEQRNLLLGGDAVAQNPLLKYNNLYYQPGGPTSALNLGYDAGCSNATVTSNYQAGNTEFGNCMPVSMTGNTFYGSISGFTQSQYPNNTYYSSRPSGVKVQLRPNQYEAGRANFAVYNWDLADSVDVDLSSVLSAGSYFEIHNAQDYFASAVASGTYGGGSVTVPLSGLTQAKPVGFSKPNTNSTEFNVFVVSTVLQPGEFFDVPASDLFHDSIQKISLDGITAGCRVGYYCPDNSVTRAEMAVFLIKSEHGATYTPPPATGQVFQDVPAGSFAADFIEEIHTEGITAGCDAQHYCPSNAASRAEMAVFLLKTSLGSGYTPPPATGTVFSDVPRTAFAAAWIEDLAARGISAGCGGGKFCPDASVRRDEMAAFLVNTFNLP